MDEFGDKLNKKFKFDFTAPLTTNVGISELKKFLKKIPKKIPILQFV